MNMCLFYLTSSYWIHSFWPQGEEPTHQNFLTHCNLLSVLNDILTQWLYFYFDQTRTFHHSLHRSLSVKPQNVLIWLIWSLSFAFHNNIHPVSSLQSYSLISFIYGNSVIRPLTPLSTFLCDIPTTIIGMLHTRTFYAHKSLLMLEQWFNYWIITRLNRVILLSYHQKPIIFFLCREHKVWVRSLGF